jgi:DGQHR domain-containing protein
MAQNLGFKVFIFDDPEHLGPEIKLREESKDGEIDAVLLYKNVICLAAVNKGKREHANKELRKFFEKLDMIDKVEALRLKLKVTAKPGKNIEEQVENAGKLLEEIEEHVKSICNEYDPILRKVFFCPFERLEEEIITELQEGGKFVIDKDVHDYFEEVLNRLDKPFLFNDFMHFLKVTKVGLEKKSASKTQKPKKSQPFTVNRLPLKEDKIIMYSVSVRVEDIVGLVTVLRVSRKYDKKGFQRMVKPGRLKKINEDYLNKNQTFPNNIIIALSPDLYTNERDFYDIENDELTFFDEYNSLIIIDGQHRFFSLVKGNKSDRHILVTLVFFSDIDKQKSNEAMVRMFYEINKKQERIDPNLSFILKAKIDPDSPEGFWYDVFKNLDRIGFFAKRFSFKETTIKRKEDPRSIVSVVTYGGVLLLNKKYKKKGIEVDGLDSFYGLDRSHNIDFASNLLRNYFNIMEAVLHGQGVDKNCLTPREIGALIRLIKHFMFDNKSAVGTLGDIADITKSAKHEAITKYFQDILDYIPFGDAIKLEYPASNWAAVEGYMLRKINSKRSRFSSRNLLSKKALEIYEA